MKKEDKLNIVCIIEDQKYFEKILQTFCSSYKFNFIGSFTNLEKFINNTNNEKIDIILYKDQSNNILNKLDTISIIKRNFQHTNIIIVIDEEKFEEIIPLITAGAAGYVLKDTPAKQILMLLQGEKENGPIITKEFFRKIVELLNDLFFANSEISLTNREKEINKLYLDGLTYKEIAKELYLSPNTVRTHIRNINSKLKMARNRQLC